MKYQTSLVTVFLGSRTSYWIALSVSRFLAQGHLGLVKIWFINGVDNVN